MGVHVDVRPVHLCIPASNIKHLVHIIMYMLLVVYYKESGILILDSTATHSVKVTVSDAPFFLSKTCGAFQAMQKVKES